MLTCVLCVQDAENLASHVSMSLVMIIVVKDIGKESLCLHVIEDATSINIMLVEDDFDMLYAISSTP